MGPSLVSGPKDKETIRKEYRNGLAEKAACRAGLGPPQVGGPKYKENIRKQVLEALLAQLAPGSRVAYDIAWKQWVLFCKARDRDPFLWGSTWAERMNDEELLLEFLVHLIRTLGKTTSTAKNKLMAVRNQHLLRGIPDPICDKACIFGAIQGFDRIQGLPKRKWPVTLKMIRWMVWRF